MWPNDPSRRVSPDRHPLLHAHPVHERHRAKPRAARRSAGSARPRELPVDRPVRPPRGNGCPGGRLRGPQRQSLRRRRDRTAGARISLRIAGAPSGREPRAGTAELYIVGEAAARFDQSRRRDRANHELQFRGRFSSHQRHRAGWRRGASMTSPATVAFTVDLESDCPPFLQGYRGIERGLPPLLHLLAEKKIPATFFATGEVATRYAGAVESIVAAGHELGCHGMTHTAFTTLDRNAARREINTSVAILRRFAPVTSFRAPYLKFPREY